MLDYVRAEPNPLQDPRIARYLDPHLSEEEAEDLVADLELDPSEHKRLEDARYKAVVRHYLDEQRLLSDRAIELMKRRGQSTDPNASSFYTEFQAARLEVSGT